MQIKRINLLGTTRTVAFEEGLNVIAGPISTGKTSLLRLCRIALGGAIRDIPPEVSLVSAISADLVIGEYSCVVQRNLESSARSLVHVVEDSRALRLPAQIAPANSDETYGNWLLRKMGIPVLRVPSAPTKPEGNRTALSINDFMAYCSLPKEEIRSDVFGHRHPQKDIKRRYVFAVAYRQYDAEAVGLQDNLRTLRDELRRLANLTETFDELVEGTQWEDRSALQNKLSELQDEHAMMAEEGAQQLEVQQSDSEISSLRASVMQMDNQLAEQKHEIETEEASLGDLQELLGQLNLQHDRLTRTLVAREKLFDIQFVQCPRCGSPLKPDRSDEIHCYLCLQEPTPSYSEEDLLEEQHRIYSQISETQELIEMRRRRLASEQKRLEQKREERESLGKELDFRTKSYVSDSVEHLRELASRRSMLKSEISRCKSALELYHRRDAASAKRTQIEMQERVIESQVEMALTRKSDVEERIEYLESQFTRLLRSFSLPEFLESPVGRIDRTTYMPSVNARKFDELQSEGLSIEVNVAHALAHQISSIDQGLLLPGILLIDGISGAFGPQGHDPKRVAALYEQLAITAAEYRDDLQIIVADTYVPKNMTQFVRLQLTETERLIPEIDITRLQQEG